MARILTGKRSAEDGKPGRTEFLRGIRRQSLVPSATRRVVTPVADELKVQTPLTWVFDRLGIKAPRLLAKLTSAVVPVVSANILLDQIHTPRLHHSDGIRVNQAQATNPPDGTTLINTGAALNAGFWYLEGGAADDAGNVGAARCRLQVPSPGGGSATTTLGYFIYPYQGKWSGYAQVDQDGAQFFVAQLGAHVGIVNSYVYCRRVF